MSKLSSLQDLDAQHLVRAIGISLIVANHASYRDLHGGLNLLLILSGMSFAQVCLARSQGQDFLRASYRFVMPFAVASVAMAVFWAIYNQQFRFAEIAMYSNWITTDRNSGFQIWYSQAFLQMLLVLIPLIWLSAVPPKFQQWPVRVSLVALAVSVVIAVVAKVSFDTSPLKDRLPHLYVWNFVLGWLFWAVLINGTPQLSSRLSLTLLTFGVLATLLIGMGYPFGALRVAMIAVPILILIWVSTVRVPFLVAHVTRLIAMSTLSIFFLHYPFMSIYDAFFGGLLESGSKLNFVLRASAGIAGSVAVWIAFSAYQNTAHKLGKTKGTVSA